MITSASKLLVVAAAACGAALAQPTDEVAPTDSEQLLLEQIDQLRAAQGLNAEGQIAPLRGLALLYQESGDHVLAVNALEEARQVLRAKRGLRSASVACGTRAAIPNGTTWWPDGGRISAACGWRHRLAASRSGSGRARATPLPSTGPDRAPVVSAQRLRLRTPGLDGDPQCNLTPEHAPTRA